MLNLHMGRLVLRPMCSADASWITRDIANPNVHRWLTSVPCPYRIEDADQFIESFAIKEGFRVIVDDGEPLGMISIESARSFDANRSALPELGYWLAERAWGRGVMSDAARAMVDWFFDGQGDEIGSGWIQGNTRSPKVLTKLGFLPTGKTLMRHAYFHGKEMPVIRVTLTKDHWQRAKPA